MGVAQGVQVELRAPVRSVAAGDRKIDEAGDFRKPRTNGVWMGCLNTTNGLLEGVGSLNSEPQHLRHFSGLASGPGLSILAAP